MIATSNSLTQAAKFVKIRESSSNIVDWSAVSTRDVYLDTKSVTDQSDVRKIRRRRNQQQKFNSRDSILIRDDRVRKTMVENKIGFRAGFCECTSDENIGCAFWRSLRLLFSMFHSINKRPFQDKVKRENRCCAVKITSSQNQFAYVNQHQTTEARLLHFDAIVTSTFD